MKSLFIVLGLFFAFTFAEDSKAQCIRSYSCHKDNIQSGSASKYAVTSRVACALQCCQITNCTAFVWDDHQKQCLIHTASGSLSTKDGFVTCEVCQDKVKDCPRYARDGFCRRMPDKMKQYCAKTCHLCGDVPPKVKCGLPATLGLRIIHGDTAKKDEWPWQVGIYFNGQFICGGSIINANWILTAAHCVQGFDYRHLIIVAGDFNRNDTDHDEQILYVYKNPLLRNDFNQPTEYNNDVALLMTHIPIIFSKHVRPICLPKSNEQVPVGTTCVITGWGQYQKGESGPLAVILQKAYVKIVSQKTCAELNAKQKHHIPITKHMVCAGNEQKVKSGGCHGDSGGPLACRRDEDSRWVLQGAISWGSRTCDLKESYTVFARIGIFVDWIIKNTKEEVSSIA